MIQEVTALPQLAGDLRTVAWLLGGGMSLLILKEVFAFIKGWKKNGTTTTIISDVAKHELDTSVAHALQSSCLGRLESASLAQTAALIEITSALRRENHGK